MTVLRASSSPLVFVTLCALAHASFTAAVTPPFSTSPCARFAGWETFTQAYNAPNFPDVAGSNELGAEITQLVPGAIITSGGNIYDPFQAMAFRLTDTAAADVLEVVLQTSTFGNSPATVSFTLTYVDGGGQDVVLAPTQVVPLVQLPQQHDEFYFRWDLSAVPEAVLAYRIEWIDPTPSMSLDAVQLDVRLDCPAGTVYCAGDGSATACPCGNLGTTGNGCANSVNPSGARLGSSGIASLANDTLTLLGSGMPDSTSLYLQGSSAQAGGLGAVFGDGLRCVAGSVVRLGQTPNISGASAYPLPGQQPVSLRGGITLAGTLARYQVWYRNAASFCTASTFNLSNGYQITWLP